MLSSTRGRGRQAGSGSFVGGRSDIRSSRRNDVVAVYDGKPHSRGRLRGSHPVHTSVSVDEFGDMEVDNWYGSFLPHYGNYCGPYWSDGQRQISVADGMREPVDYGDSMCQTHDAAYANDEDLRTADLNFAGGMIGRGDSVGSVLRNTAMGVAVGTQGVFRPIVDYVGNRPGRQSSDVSAKSTSAPKPYKFYENVTPTPFNPF